MLGSVLACVGVQVRLQTKCVLRTGTLVCAAGHMRSKSKRTSTFFVLKTTRSTYHSQTVPRTLHLTWDLSRKRQLCPVPLESHVCKQKMHARPLCPPQQRIVVHKASCLDRWCQRMQKKLDTKTPPFYLKHRRKLRRQLRRCPRTWMRNSSDLCSSRLDRLPTSWLSEIDKRMRTAVRE